MRRIAREDCHREVACSAPPPRASDFLPPAFGPTIPHCEPASRAPTLPTHYCRRPPRSAVARDLVGVGIRTRVTSCHRPAPFSPPAPRIFADQTFLQPRLPVF